MHDGSEPYEGVLRSVEELKKAGKKMIILSNSSKRRANSEKMLVKREYSTLSELIVFSVYYAIADAIILILM